MVDHETPTFRVTLGNTRGTCKSELIGYETILPKCVKDVVKGNTIFWKIIIRAGKFTALAKILDLYGTSITSRVLPKGIEVPDALKKYINLKARTHLKWKPTSNGWIITKSLQTHDFGRVNVRAFPFLIFFRFCSKPLIEKLQNRDRVVYLIARIFLRAHPNEKVFDILPCCVHEWNFHVL